MNKQNRNVLDHLRCIAADMLDVVSMVFEDQPLPDFRPTIKTFSTRVSEASDFIEGRLQQSEEDELNSRRWKLLFETEGVAWEKKGEEFFLYESIFSGGQKIGLKLLGRAESLPVLADTFLGIKS